MEKVNPNKVGLVLGAFLGGLHFLWSLLVAIGWAQPLVDFIFRIHFIEPVYQIQEFDLGASALLIFIAAFVGYVVGNVVGNIWNRVHK